MADKWESLVIKAVTKGYNSSVVPNMLPDGASPKIENLMFSRGRLTLDYGYGVLGNALYGTPRVIHQYDKKNGSSEILLVTNKTFYKWAVGEWQYVASATSTLADGGEPAGETDLVVDSISGFSDGDYIGVILDNGRQHRTTINGVPAGTTLVMTDAVPTGRTVVDNAVVVLACAFSGQLNKPIIVDDYPAADAVLISTSFDTVQIYDGSSCEDIANLAAAGGGAYVYARTVRLKDNKVILFGTNESGTDYPQRVRWCATGDHTDWTTAGDAGFEDLYNSADYIMAAFVMGPYVIIYRTKSIYRMEYVGSADLIYNFDRMLQGIGTVSAHSVLEKDGAHVVMGPNSFYAYAGGYQVEEFGAEVWESIYGVFATLSTTYKQNSFITYIASRRQYFFMIPSDGASDPSRVWIYDLRTKSWTTRVFYDNILSVKEIELVGSQAWIAQTGAWNEQLIMPWNDPTLSVGESIILMAGMEAGENYVFKYSSSYLVDGDDCGIRAGATITCEFQTQELYYPGYKIRINKVRMTGAGTLVITYSTDEGETWNTYGTASCASSPTDRTYSTKDVNKQLTVDRVMFKVTSNTIAGIDTIQIYWKLETEY